MINAFKFRAQAIFSLLEKTTPPPPPPVHKICVREFFHYSSIQSTQITERSNIYKKTGY